VQGLIAQGRTIEETLEIAKDAAKKLIDAETAEAVGVQLPPTRESFGYPLIVNA
jgi:predicted RNase H-like HicB family nuclease